MVAHPDLSLLVVSRGDVTLRPVTPDDKTLLRRWLTDPEVYKWWGGAPATDAKVLEHCAAHTDESGSSWPFIIESASGAAGYIQAWRDNDGACGIDLFIDPKHRRQGIGSSAAELLARHLRDAFGWGPITADPAVDNLASIAMWEKAGFEKTGEMIDIGDGPSALMVFRGTARPGTSPPWT